MERIGIRIALALALVAWLLPAVADAKTYTVRERVGVYGFVTAPLAVPAGYEPILRPEYPWGYFD